MVASLTILAALGLIGLLAWALWCEIIYCEPRAGDEIVHVEAADGHLLGMVHYRARGEVRRGEPVVLCHGLSVNRHNMDLDDETSLALYLARQGFDVYALDLRGRGYSRGGRWIPRHGFDDYVQLDLPAVIEGVRRRHRTARIHWVGHSMGGLVLYAHLARNPEAPVRSAVTVGSPVRLQLPWWARLSARIPAWLPPVLPILQARLAFLIAPLVGLWYPGLVRYILHPEHTRPRRVRRAVANLVADISGPELQHFSRMVLNDAFCSLTDGLDYRAGMADIRTPTLVIAGNRDLLARAEGVHEGFARLGSPEKRYLLLGSDAGPVAFGHGDLLIGDYAPRLVFPEIEAWLRQHDPAETAGGPQPRRETVQSAPAAA